MVFSQTSHKTHSILKVDINCINDDERERERQVNCLAGVVATTKKEAPPSPVATTSFTEEYLKPEVAFEETMFYDMGAGLELFQVLDQPYINSADEELLQTIDPSKLTTPRAHDIDTTHTSFSPQGWDNDVSSPNATGFYSSTPVNELSPNNKIDILDFDNDSSLALQEQFLDLNHLPVVLEDMTSDMTNTNTYTHTQEQMPLLLCQEDTMDFNYTGFVEPREIENNIIITEYTFDDSAVDHGLTDKKEKKNLMLTVPAPGQSWYNDVVISTPDVLNCVEQLETNNLLLNMVDPFEMQEAMYTSEASSAPVLPLLAESVPVTPKSELEDYESDVKPFSSRKRRCSEESDETYVPHQERTSPRKYKRHKTSIPLKEKILALKSSQQTTTVRRGRPPKRRDSVVSVCSIDESMSSSSAQDSKYRFDRDKNNEASKRSRMKKKLKDLEMEELATHLEEKNSRLRAKVATLEELTKKLKDTFKSIILGT